MKNFSESLRKHTIKIINLKRKTILNKKLQKSYENTKTFYIYKNRNFKINIWKIKNVAKLEIIALYRGI